MRYLPTFFDIENQPCLVVGGGMTASRKAWVLQRAGAQVTVVAPDVTAPELSQAIEERTIRHVSRCFRPDDVTGSTLIIAATDDTDANQQISAAAKRYGIPVNVVDHPELCTFVMPSVIDRSPLVIAISTGGAAPVLARHLRGVIERLLPRSYGRLAGLMGAFRDRVRARFATGPERRRFWEAMLEGPIARRFLEGDEVGARNALDHALTTGQEGVGLGGEVLLVGAGPGDPDLLTLRALRALESAETVVYDHLVDEAVLDLARRDAARVYVGKERGRHCRPQEEINALLIELAQQGQRVVRLKGGDPFVFGRGGEEAEALSGAGVRFQVIPGITAALGCAAAAGIPLTHRDVARTCVLATGHSCSGADEPDWKVLTKPKTTVVWYMCVHRMKDICADLLRHGAAPEIPAAVIEHGTTQAQRVIEATLADLAEVAQEADVQAPALMIVGDVVGRRQRPGTRHEPTAKRAGGPAARTQEAWAPMG